MSHRKRWRWLDIQFATTEDVSLTVEWLSGKAPDDAAAIGSVIVMPAAEPLVSADGSAILSDNGSAIIIAQSSAQTVAPLKNGSDYLHDEGIRIRVKDNAANGSWALEAMQIAFQILPGLKRRFQ